MRTLLSIVVGLTHALWLGGIIALFIFVSAMFGHSRELGSTANPILFQKWESWRLILAIVALVSAFSWWMLDRRKSKLVFAGLILLASLAGAISTAVITPKIERLRVAGQTSTAEFRSAHGQSMIAYCAEAGLLLIAGMILPCAQRNQARTVLADRVGD